MKNQKGRRKSRIDEDHRQTEEEKKENTHTKHPNEGWRLFGTCEKETSNGRQRDFCSHHLFPETARTKGLSQKRQKGEETKPLLPNACADISVFPSLDIQRCPREFFTRFFPDTSTRSVRVRLGSTVDGSLSLFIFTCKRTRTHACRPVSTCIQGA